MQLSMNNNLKQQPDQSELTSKSYDTSKSILISKQVNLVANFYPSKLTITSLPEAHSGQESDQNLILCSILMVPQILLCGFHRNFQIQGFCLMAPRLGAKSPQKTPKIHQFIIVYSFFPSSPPVFQ